MQELNNESYKTLQKEHFKNLKIDLYHVNVFQYLILL